MQRYAGRHALGGQVAEHEPVVVVGAILDHVGENRLSRIDVAAARHDEAAVGSDGVVVGARLGHDGELAEGSVRGEE